jgi:hypothetical protein
MQDNLPIILENFISEEDIEKIVKVMSDMESGTPDGKVLGALGLQSSFRANEININNPVIPLSDNQDKNDVSLILTQTMINVRESIEKFFNVELSLRQMNYVNMLEGSWNDVHTDTIRGNDYKTEYTGLLYLSEDFGGGELCFPTIDLLIKPKPGLLVYFKGDHTLPHEVKHITSGSRKHVVMFFGRRTEVGTVDEIYEFVETSDDFKGY